MRRGMAVTGIIAVLVIAGGIGAPAQDAVPAPASSAPLALSTMISKGLDILAGRSLPLLISIAAIGVIAMAVQQAIKDLWQLARGFNRRRFDAWCLAQGGSRETRDLLVSLAVGGADNTTNPTRDQALFDLSIPGMTAQMAAAAKFALAFPDQTTRVLDLVVGRLGVEDVQTLVDATVAERTRTSAGAPMTPAHEARLAKADEARTRLGFIIDRRLDAFQVESTSRWEHVNKLAAFFISAILAVLAMILYIVSYSYWTPLTKGQVTTLVALVPLAALVAGFVAPVAKDLVTALQSVRGSR